ncbi:TetR/AcrR family transcriptional regulator [Nonomuraea guangzhouensis]|uniref:TetR/AcrR family transcriptional regulator n=1 Tax=Nonomuraea guangzhouensis TaxID=1291555 RepID=A0ABW4FZ32_9ACTN|nr:TetR/AcrR family transcriptional regulator [Nonomuraea guangzhouensis]
MGRPRGFDETEVIRAAAALFADRAYDGVSVDDLVNHLGVHRNSLYKTFGSKRGLYLAALRWHVEHQVRPLVSAVGAAGDLAEAVRGTLAAHDDGGALDLLLMAAAERAPVDQEVRAEVCAALDALDQAIGTVLTGAAPDRADRVGEPSPALAGALTAALIGLRLRARATTAATESDRAAAALVRCLAPNDLTI